MATEIILKIELDDQDVKAILGNEMYLENDPKVIDKELLESCLEEAIQTFINKKEGK